MNFDFPEKRHKTKIIGRILCAFPSKPLCRHLGRPASKCHKDFFLYNILNQVSLKLYLSKTEQYRRRNRFKSELKKRKKSI